MPRKKLTANFISTLKPPEFGQVDYWDTSLPGFGLRVSAGGRKAWVVMYRHQGRKRRMTIGTFPAVALSDARENAGDILRAASKGHDPAGEKKVGRKADIFSDFADLYMEKYAKGREYVKWEEGGKKGDAPEPNKRSWTRDRSVIESILKPKWKHRKAYGITRRDVNEVLNELVDRGVPIQANRTLSVIRKMYSWGIGTSRVLMDVNPCHEVKKPAKEVAKERVLNDTEIVALWNKLDWSAMDDEGKPPPISRQRTLLALRLVLITAQRPGEVIGMAWDELDTEWEKSDVPFWTIPSSRTKNKMKHRVPLTALAVEHLKAVKELVGDSPWAFPSPRSGIPVSGNSVSHAVWSEKSFGIDKFTPHDLRRTASTNMTGKRCGVSRFILERVLNHKDQSVTNQHYDHYDYDDEKCQALMTWARALKSIIAGEAVPSNVVELAGRGR